MCRIITAVIPASTDLKALKPLLLKHGFQFKAIHNSHILEQLNGELYVHATGSWCDCKSCFGINSSPHQTEALQTHASEIEKLKKKGWSQNKIERWLADKDGATERKKEERQNMYDAELKKWRNFLEAALSQHGLQHIGLMIHMYNERLEEAKINLRTVVVPRFDQFEQTVLSMDEDVLYRFSIKPTNFQNPE